MKYSDSNPPLVCMLTNSTCYKGTRTMVPKGVLWHSTGANNPNLKRYVQPSDNDPNRSRLLAILGKNGYGNDWNHITYQAGVNGWIGKLEDGTVTSVQALPWNYRPWGCGSGYRGTCNDYWIQFEICEDGLTDSKYFNAVYQEACELTAYLCKKYNINPKGTVSYGGANVPTILCHQDSYKLGLGSNHGDVYNWFPKHGKSMEDVRNDVYTLMNQPKEDEVDMTVAEVKTLVETTVKNNDPKYLTINDVPSYYKPTIQKLMTKGWLQGTGGNNINVSEDMCRILTILDRAGQLG